MKTEQFLFLNRVKQSFLKIHSWTEERNKQRNNKAILLRLFCAVFIFAEKELLNSAQVSWTKCQETRLKSTKNLIGPHQKYFKVPS